MTPKQTVIISRKWHHPKISMVVTDEELSFAIDLDDFVEAMKNEMNVPREDRRLEEVVQNVVRGIKGESVKVIG